MCVIYTQWRRPMPRRVLVHNCGKMELALIDRAGSSSFAIVVVVTVKMTYQSVYA
jgi:hypothetical protein